MLCAVHNAVIESLPIFPWSDAFKDGISYYRSRIVTYHAASVARTGPFREEFILARNVCKALLNLLIHRWIHKVKKREECAESVPESGVCIKVTVADLSVVWTVVDRLALWGYLVEFAREESRSI